ncbi:MAG: HAMP domain-containing sensor histidine kinase, partial [Candidatus Latescibacteria bacterium]|nr:HAMP domain-containing sensor histidine kinase [Candidatus Latescibacterota bacterium]
IEAGTISLAKEALDLHPLLVRIADDLATSLDHRVQIDIEGEEISVNADRNLLTGVFHNLIKNAAEHIVELDDESQRIVRLRLSKGLGKTIVAINNGGDPVPQDLLDAFFEKFNTENKPGGTGLGTTYAALVTHAHDGDIAVTSTQEEGTTVTVTLPA